MRRPILGLYTQDQVVEDVRAVMDAVGVERAVVGGHSLGGYTSLRFYQRYPARVRGLILSDTGPGYRKMRGAAGWTSNNERLAAKLEARWPEADFDARAAGVGRHGGDAPIRHTAHGLASVYRGVMRMPPMVECGEVKALAIVLVGEEDTPFPGAVGVHGREAAGRARAGGRAGRVALVELRRPGRLERGGRRVPGGPPGLDARTPMPAPPMPVRAAASPPRRSARC